MAKTYPNADLARMAGMHNSDLAHALTKAGIKPVRVVKTAHRNFRHWGRDAYDWVQVYLEQQSADPPLADTPPADPPACMLVAGGELGRIAPVSIGIPDSFQKIIDANKPVGQDGKPYVSPIEQMQQLFGSVSLHSLKAQLDRIEKQQADIQQLLTSVIDHLTTPKVPA